MINKVIECTKELKNFSFSVGDRFYIDSISDKDWIYNIFIVGVENNIKCLVNRKIIENNFKFIGNIERI